MNRLKDMKPAPQIKMPTGTTGNDKQWVEAIRKGTWTLLQPKLLHPLPLKKKKGL